jgi:dephospho-CoA kinase
MDFFVLGITGKRGCGKDTMAEYLRLKYGFRVLTYTNDVLSPLLSRMGKEITRENLISLALDLRARNGKHVLTEMICDKIERRGFWAISGVRYPEEVEYFKERLGGSFMLVKIDCSAENRHERVVLRGTKGEGRMTMEQFLEVEERETEKVINETIKLANFSLDNDGKLGEFYRRIDDLARKLGVTASHPP